MADQVRLSIEGMHCDHCDVTVGAALERAGLDEVRVDWRRGEAIGTPGASFSAERAGDEVSQLFTHLGSRVSP